MTNKFKNGLYCSTKPVINRNLLKLLKKFSNLENKISIDELHCTVQYSTKIPNTDEIDNEVEIDFNDVYIIGCDVWKTKTGKNCLVILLESESLQTSHEKIKDILDLSYDYDVYKPHMTLSYDCGDYAAKNMDTFRGLVLPFKNLYFQNIDVTK